MTGLDGRLSSARRQFCACWGLVLTVGTVLPLACATFLHADCEAVFPMRAYATDAPVYAVAIGDLDRDGQPEAVIGAYHALYVLRNNGSEGFSPPETYDFNGIVTGVAVGDFDGDGWQDAIACTGRLHLLRNDGAGGLLPPVSHDLHTWSETCDAADLDGDGDLDALLTTQYGEVVYVLYNDGNGEFTEWASFGVGVHPTDVAFGDFNGDGGLDIAVANNRSNNVSILLSDGFGGFLPGTQYLVGYRPESIASADVTGDGVLDLLVACDNPFGSGQFSVLYGDGAGGFDVQHPMHMGDRLGAVEAADVDDDGDVDALVSVRLDVRSMIRTLENRGDGLLDVGPVIPAGSRPNQLHLTDLDGDGRLNLIHDDGRKLVVLDGTSEGGFAAADFYSEPVSADAAALADLNSDGVLDVVSVDRHDLVLVRLGLGDGTFGTLQTYPAFYRPEALLCADADGDGDVDLQLALGASDEVAIWLNDGSGQFPDVLTVHVGDRPRALAAADFDGDGDADLAVTTDDDGEELKILLNDGAGSFQLVASHASEGGPHVIAAADIDGDGDVDIAVQDVHGSTCSIFTNEGGDFQRLALLEFDASVYWIGLVDADNDGDVDLLLLDDSDDAILAALNDGTGHFAEPIASPAGLGPSHADVADINCDGLLDLVIIGDNIITIAIGDGTGAFLPLTAHASPISLGVVLTGDLDNDTDVDLVTLGGSGNYTAVYMNQGHLPCVGDLNGDRYVNQKDLGLLLVAYEKTDGGDIDGDGDTDQSDLSLLLINYDTHCN